MRWTWGGLRRGNISIPVENGDQEKVCESDFQRCFRRIQSMNESESVGDSCGFSVCVLAVSSCVLVVIGVSVSPLIVSVFGEDFC